MKTRYHRCGIWLSAAASLMWLLPVSARGADGTGRAPTVARAAAPGAAGLAVIRDVALGSEGRLAGQYVDSQGRGKAGERVVVQRQGSEPRAVLTDSAGRFQVAGLGGGTYQIAVGDAAVLCRCWTDRAAPPSAQREILLVAGEGLQRGQHPFGDILFSAPVLICLVIAAAIAIPIAVHNSQDDAS